MHSSRSQSFFAPLSVGIGATLWGVIWFPMRVLEHGGLQGIWLTLIMFASAMIASLPYTYRAGVKMTRAPVWPVVLMIAAGWTNVAFVEAVLHGNVLRVLLLFYLSPLWATLLGRLFLRERVSRAAGLSLAVALAGALLMLWNPDVGLPWPGDRADWLALTSGLAFALANVATRGLHDVSLAAKVFCVGFGVTVMAAAIIALLHVAVPQVSFGIVGGAVVLGVCGILVMTFLVQYGVSHLPVYRSSVITLVELVAGAVSQALLTNEVVTAREWTGGALIALGAYLAARASARN